MDLKLLTEYNLGGIILKNRVVMAPMTRSRCTGNIPNDMVAKYYGQRSGAGLIVTEGTSPSPNGLGYPRIPGIFSRLQVEGWKKVTEAVHNEGSVIFLQMMHTGRVTHPFNLPEGGRVIAPSAVRLEGHMRTDRGGVLEFPDPEEMTEEDVNVARQEYINGALNAVEAGFDGVELHSANGYLLEQFISPYTNLRSDGYGGTIEKRCRFVLEVAGGVATAIGRGRTGIRLSPYGVASGMKHYPEIEETYGYLAGELDRIGIAYIHVLDNSSRGAPPVPESVKLLIRKHFRGTLILAGGYDLEKAEKDLRENRGDLIAFARSFINNPDLVERFRNGWPVNTYPDPALFYTPGEKGYTDYPSFEDQKVPDSMK